MSEREIKSDNSHWVALRDTSKAFTGQQHFDMISWNPNLIPEAQSVLVDVGNLTKLIRDADIRSNIRIVSFKNEVERDRINILGVNPKGEATGIKSQSKSGNETAADFFVSYDEETNTSCIHIDFDLLTRKSLVDSKLDIKKYAYSIDRVVKKALPQVFVDDFSNIALLSETERIALGADSLKFGGNILVLIAVTLVTIDSDYKDVDMSSLSTLKSLYEIFAGTTIYSLMINVGISQHVRNKSSRKEGFEHMADLYNDFLKSGGKLLEIAKVATPYMILNKLFASYLKLKLYKKELFRASPN